MHHLRFETKRASDLIYGSYSTYASYDYSRNKCSVLDILIDDYCGA